MAKSASWYLYLLECEGGSIYTGITTDVDRRYHEHCAGTGAKYTRSRKPVRLLAALPFDSRSIATRAELAVKKLPPGAKRSLCMALALLDDEAQRRALIPGLGDTHA